MILEEKERGLGMGVYHGENEKQIVRTYRATMVITKSKRTPHKYHNVTRDDSIQRIDLKNHDLGFFFLELISLHMVTFSLIFQFSIRL